MDNDSIFSADTAASPAGETQPPVYGQPIPQPAPQPTPQPILQPTPQDFRNAAKGKDAKEAGASRRLSLPARAGLWLVGIVCGVTLLMLCAVAWVFGTSYLRDAAAGEKPSVQQQAPPEHDDGENFFMLPDGNGGYIPWNGDPDTFNDFFEEFYGGADGFGGGTTSGSDSGAEQNAPKPGMGITAQEFQPVIAIEGYEGGLLILEIREEGAFADTEVQVNDLIVAFNHHPTPTLDKLDAVLGRCKPGDKATVTIARYKSGSAELFDVDITLIDMNTLSD